MAKRRGPVGPFFSELDANDWFRLRPGGEAYVKAGRGSAACRGFLGHYWRGSIKVGDKTPVLRMNEAEVAAHLAAQPPPGEGELHPSEVKDRGTAITESAFNPFKKAPPARPAGDKGRVPPRRRAGG